MDIKKQTFAVIGVVFLLLGALFGVQIMNFMFGNLGIVSESSIDDLTGTYYNVSAYINSTGYYIPEVSNRGFSGGFVVIEAYNVTNSGAPSLIPSTNYTVDPKGFLNASTMSNYTNVNITYTANYQSSAKLSTNDVTNNSLESLRTYSEGASTQMNIITIVIVIALLIGVFALVWNLFMGKSQRKENRTAGNFS